MSPAGALLELARQAGILEPMPGYPRQIAELITRLPVRGNEQVAACDSGEVPGARRRHLIPRRERLIAGPVFTNGRPTSFREQPDVEYSPAFDVLELPNGFVVRVASAPVVLASDGVSLVQDFSSPYAGLVHRYELNLQALLDVAYRVEGTAVVLCDDIHPLNFSHWLLDELPRLALLGEDRDVTVVTSDEDRPFKRETLRLCGFPNRRVIYLEDLQAVQASRLLVPSDIAEMPHPAHKAAPWVLDFLRSRLGFSALAAQAEHTPTPAKLFISRDDGQGRRIVNEAELMRALEPLGYVRVTLVGRTVADQIALFARASHVVGAHGAGLSNFAFAPHGARLLEIFPQTYGTPAFYVLAAGQGNPYATYIAADVIPGDRTQTDDIRIEVSHFLRCCGALL